MTGATRLGGSASGLRCLGHRSGDRNAPGAGPAAARRFEVVSPSARERCAACEHRASVPPMCGKLTHTRSCAAHCWRFGRILRFLGAVVAARLARRYVWAYDRPHALPGVVGPPGHAPHASPRCRRVARAPPGDVARCGASRDGDVPRCWS